MAFMRKSYYSSYKIVFYFGFCTIFSTFGIDNAIYQQKTDTLEQKPITYYMFNKQKIKAFL